MPVEQSNNLPGSGGELTKDDILDELNIEDIADDVVEGDEGKKEAKKEKKEKVVAKEEDNEEHNAEEEDEEDIEYPDENELNLVTPVRRKEILAKYPSLFKDFPYLQTAYYRDEQFTEIFPTVDDAKEAQEKAKILDNFEQDLGNGNFDKVLASVKQNDPEKFKTIVDNYLMQLGNVDRDALHHVVGNVIKNSVINVLQFAQANSNEELKEAAILFYRSIFQSDKIEPPTNLGKKNAEVDTERERLNKERQEFVRQQFETARDGLNTKVQNAVKSTIANHIDPRNSMLDYVRKNAIRDAQENLDKLMEQDARFTTVMDKLWEQAFKDNFSNKSIEQIRSTFLSKAKTLLPQVIKAARAEALRTSRTSNRDETKDRKGPLPIGGRSDKQETKNAKSPSKIPSNMKTLDYLNSD